MRLSTLLALALVVGALGWIRLAPSDADQWHTDPADPALRPGPGRYLVCNGGDAAPIPAGPDTLARLNEVALATPRTRHLAGTADSGRITWITRTRMFGFPDYTTAAIVPSDAGPVLCIHARLRFGTGDGGVNARRVRNWLARLSP